SVRDALRVSVGGTVAMVPEGLVLLTSVAFAVGVVRLAKRPVPAQDPPAVEVLARVDVLCIDKTGTLTEGRLVVGEVELLGEDGSHRDALAALAAAEPHPNATLLAIRESFPDPREGGLAGRSGPFSSARKWSGADFGTRGTWVLGAPDVLLGSRPGDDAQLTKARAHAGAGRRVVLLGRTEAPIEADARPAGLVPVAYVILTDRVRETASTTLAYFAQQGVNVKVISGDHPQTVAAVARHVGLPGAEAPFDAKALPEGGRELADALETHAVLGRGSPQQKGAMGEAPRSRGHVVAMTGDGVNDVLALKDADIGVAMGS